MLKITRTASSFIVSGTVLAALVSAPQPAGALAPGLLADVNATLVPTSIKGGGGDHGGGGSVSTGANDWVLDIPQPDYSRPNLDYNLPSPGPNDTFKSRAALCKKKHKSYNPKTGTYIGKDGRRYRCY